MTLQDLALQIGMAEEELRVAHGKKTQLIAKDKITRLKRKFYKKYGVDYLERFNAEASDER